jgi:putative transposase
MEDYLISAKPTPPPVANLTAAHRVMIHNKPFVVIGEVIDGYKVSSEDHMSQPFTLTHAQVDQLYNAKKLHVSYDANKPENRHLDLVLNGKTLDDCKPQVELKVRRLKWLINVYNTECIKNGKISRSNPGFQEWLTKQTVRYHKELRASEKPEFKVISTSQFNRMFNRIKNTGNNIRALIPRNSGPGKKTVQFSPESFDFAVREARAYLSPLEPEKIDVFEWYKAALYAENQTREESDQLYQFGKTKFYEIIASFPAFDVMAARKTEAYAREHFSPNLMSFMEHRPGSLVQIDEWKGDMMTLVAKTGQLKTIPRELHKHLKKIRIWLVVAICVATRMPLAVHAVPKPNAAAAIDTLRMILSDKTRYSQFAGAQNLWKARVKPEHIYMDNGSAFISESLTQVTDALNIGVSHPAAGKPKKRPHIESLFHSIGPKLTVFFHGRTFHNIIAKGDYNPKEMASLLVSEFVSAFHLGICDIYALKAHASLGGRSPQSVWNEACANFKYDPPPGPIDLLHAFGKPETAVIGSYGIEKRGISYWNHELIEQYKSQGKKPIKIKWDASNVASILVRAEDDHWYEVENKSQVPDGTTQAEWDMECKKQLIANKAETDRDAPIVHAATNRLRKMGEELAERAGLPPIEVPQEKIDRASSQVYTGYPQGTPSGFVKPTVADTFSQLRDNTRRLQPGLPAGASELSLPAPGPDPVQFPSTTSEFNRRKEED